MKPIFNKQMSEEDIDKLLKIKKKSIRPGVGLKGTIFLAVVSLLLAFILIPRFTLPRKTFVEGEPAPSLIKAHRSFEIEDSGATQKLKDSAESAIKSVYDYDSTLYTKSIKKLFSAFERIRKDYYKGPKRTLVSPHTRDMAKKAFEEALGGIQIDNAVYSYLEAARFNWRMTWTVNRLIRLLRKQFIVADKAVFGPEIERGITVRNVDQKKEFSFDEFVNVLDVNEAKQRIRRGTSKIYKVYNKEGRKYVGRLATHLIFPNLSFNSAETKKRKEEAVASIKPAIIKVDRGEIIVKKGEQIQKRHLIILNGIRKQFTEQRPGLFVFFTAIFLFFFFQILSSFALANFSRFKPSQKDALILGSLALVFLLGVRIYLFMTGAVGDKFTWIPDSMFIYLIPVAAAAMMARFLINMEGALIFTLALTVAISLLLGKNLFYAIYVLSSSLIGIQAVARCRTYTDIYRGGLKVALANAAIVFTIVILSSLGRSATYEELLFELIFGVMAGFFAGLLSSILVVTVTPLFEFIFGYTTDVKLLELSNLNNPVLRDLMIRAPGTYHHSIMVGTLAEHAADRVGVDPLLARVGGYYHDIGKMKNPHYFIENQFAGFNIHDKQPPHLSKTMIMSHVKEGVRTAHQRNLGQRVANIIGQHHGCTLMLYFFDKAKTKLDKEKTKADKKDEVHDKEVNESEFRYPGPKPQSAEAAIVMMADSVEAATRAMNTSSLSRLKVVCEKIVNRLFTDGQLDECDLTLKDLSQIVDSFYHVLVGIYHRRISYPGGIKAEQPYDSTYYPKQTKENQDSDEESPEVDDDDIFKKMGT